MTIFIKTLGCPKNDADSRVLSGMMADKGLSIVDSPQDADIVVINTCGFKMDAAEESIECLIEYSTELKKENPAIKVIGMGCLVQRYADDIIKEIPEVDAWIGLDTLENTAAFIQELEAKRLIPKKPNPIFFNVPNTLTQDNQSYTYLKIGDGCDRACEFCSIPTFKGSHISRSNEDIKKEFKMLIDSGKREIILVDQDITQYHYSDTGLSELIKTLSLTQGDYWLRPMYMHPDHVSDDLFESLKHVEHLIHYFDIPVQHGSDKVLKNMGRIRNARSLKNQLTKIRNIFPDAVLRTTIMLGFPGEGDKEFDQLKEFIAEVEFDKIGFFIFSPEEGTPIMRRDFQMPDESILNERLEQIQALQSDISYKKNEALNGTQMRLIVDSFEGDRLVCRSYRDAPEIDSEVFVKINAKEPLPSIGDFITARITGFDDYDLEAEIV